LTKKRRVLVTGGAGSLGRELILRLVELQHTVRVLDLPSCDFSAFEGMANVEIRKADIADADVVRSSVAGVDAVVHLAALLPPASERDRDATMAVNVGGTRNVVDALERENPDAHLVLSSSVCVYGDTTGDDTPVMASHVVHALDLYGESKIEAERIVQRSTLSYTILRISGIAVPAFLAPPEVWPFMRDQRIEFVSRGDVVEALSACVTRTEAVCRVFNVAGGATWRMRGSEYVARLNQVLGLPPEEGAYSERPGPFDWYDTRESQGALSYQRTSFDRFSALTEEAIERALGGL
jgi:UDP-glucose 4-epimerase